MFSVLGRFGVIYADCPWTWSSWGPKGEGRAASNHYDLMDLAAIKALPVHEIAEDDCALFLWATNPMLPQALSVIEAWGFTYKTVAFTWAKRTPSDTAWHFGLGYWTRQNSEQCLLGTRGKPKRLARNVPQLLVSPRREHSRKPDEVYNRIERLVGGERIELFARATRPGWTAWGNDTEKFTGAKA